MRRGAFIACKAKAYRWVVLGGLDFVVVVVVARVFADFSRMVAEAN